MNLQHEISRLKRQSEAAWQRCDFDHSMALLIQAHKLAPQDPRLLIDLGHQYGLRCEYGRAQEVFEKAIRLSRWHVAAFLLAGLQCLNFSQPLLARGYFERALKKNPDEVDVLAQLAGVYERLGQLEEAHTMATRAVALAPANKLAHLLVAKVLRRRKRLEEAETILRKLAGQPDPDVWMVAVVWYELGLNLDLQARYDEAMAAFLNAKKILLEPTEKTYAAYVENQKQRQAEARAITGDDLKKFLADGRQLSPSRRLAFLAGHPRSGTTLLEQVLDAHPEVVSLEETRIFHENTLPLFLREQKEHGGLDWLAKIPPAQLLPVRDGYFAQAEKFLGQPVGGRLLIDKNPSMTVYFEQMTRVFPESRFIVALRDPRDVCLSCFMQPIPPTAVSASYVDLGRTVQEYARVMGLWLEFRDKMAAPWLEVRYEDSVENLESTARHAIEFLNLPWDERVLGFNEHARQKVVRSPTYADVGKPIYKSSLGRWQHYRKYLEPHFELLEPFVREFGY